MQSVREGSVELQIPEEDGTDDRVFYNPEQELNRDITIGVLRALRGKNPGNTSYLDAMTATGIRGLRAAMNNWDVTCVDVNPTAIGVCRENFRRNDASGVVRRRNANAELYSNGYDVVDIDPFGTPIPYLDSAFNGTRNMLCVTATDTAPLCGAHFESGVRRYDAIPINTEYHAEIGVRVLLGAVARTAARYDVSVTPVLTHATRHYVRSYLSINRSATAANTMVRSLGWVHHCWECLWRTTETGFFPDPVKSCPNCTGSEVTTGGPLWLTAAHDASFMKEVKGLLSDEMQTRDQALQLLSTIQQELHEPTHYDHHRLCKRWKRTASAMDDVITSLHDQGYAASRTHYGGTTFKTTATVSEIRDATAQ